VIVLKMCALLGVTLAVAAAMRGRPAASRHRLLAVGLICAGLMPWFLRLAPAWGRLAPSTTTLIDIPLDWKLSWIGPAGAVVGAALLMVGWLRLAWITSSARPVADATIDGMVRELSRDLGLSRPVTLLEVDRPLMPMTWGFVRPTILLSQAARRWHKDHLRAVLAHELAHIRRGDWLIQLLIDVLVRLAWFVPVMWTASSRLKLESDRACDDAVVNLGTNARDYASWLLQTARTLKDDRQTWLSAPAAARRSGLRVRVSALLSERVNREPIGASASVLTLGLVGGLAAVIAGFAEPPRARSMTAQDVSDVQRNIMMRLGGVETRVSIQAAEVSFRHNRLAGRVELQARLGVDGAATALRFVEPAHPDLARAATDIARQWRGEPARLRGVPVEVPIRLTIDFKNAQESSAGRALY
jgi:beta-lactamase regulating signal transducer with metallopeptidase domain